MGKHYIDGQAVIIESGIAIFDVPYHTNYLDYVGRHPGCDIILKRSDSVRGTGYLGDIVATTTSAKYVDELERLFMQRYSGGDYEYLGGVSEGECSSIDCFSE